MGQYIPSRNGIPSAIAAAKELCRVVTKFRAIIILVSGGDAAVTTALDNALTSCQVLEQALEELREYGD
jgi:hypothetical protein